MTRGEKVIAFIQRYCRVPEGKFVGAPMVLEPFQRSFILDVYDNPAGTRLAYLSIARKNGKSALIASLLLAHIVGPEARLNSQIVSGARSRDQAALVFDLACKMIRLSPELSRITRIIPSGKRIIGLTMNVEFKALAAEGRTAHGLSPVLAILDEVGQVRGPQDDFIDAITTSQGAHEAPILMAISTQAATDADLFSIWLDDARSSGDPRIVAHVYEAPKGCALDDRAAWASANPALGRFRSLADVEQQAEQARRMPSEEAKFRNLVLNQRIAADAMFIAPEVWKENGGPVDDSAFYEGEVYAGLDLSARNDLTAFVMVASKGGVRHVRPMFWTPAKGLADRARRDKQPYDVWARDGVLLTTPSATVDYEFVAAEIAQATAGMNIVAVAFDRWRIDAFRRDADRVGVAFPLVPFGQGFRDMGPAIDTLESDFLSTRIRHGGNPVLTMCAANSIVVSDPAGNRKLDKRRSTGRIDGMVALAMAVGAGMSAVETVASSPWDDPNFSLVA